jgi:hypothetical protein
MLKDFAKKLYTTTKDSAAAAPAAHGSLTDVRLHLEQPVYGEVDGEPVTIIGQGNMTGFSPVSFCIDGIGENAWLPTDKILITDPRFTPVGVSATTRGQRASTR